MKGRQVSPLHSGRQRKGNKSLYAMAVVARKQQQRASNIKKDTTYLDEILNSRTAAEEAAVKTKFNL